MTEGTARAFYIYIFKFYSLSRNIITDKDTQFESKL